MYIVMYLLSPAWIDLHQPGDGVDCLGRGHGIVVIPRHGAQAVSRAVQRRFPTLIVGFGVGG